MRNVFADLDSYDLLFLSVKAFRDLTKGTSVENFLKCVSVAYVLSFLAIVEACLIANILVSHASHVIITYSVNNVQSILRILQLSLLKVGQDGGVLDHCFLRCNSFCSFPWLRATLPSWF